MPRSPTRTPLLTAALALIAACSPPPADVDPTAALRAAMAEIAADRPGSALPHFDAAIAALSPEADGALYHQAVLGRLDALAQHDPNEVSAAFADALEAAPDLFTPADCGKVANSLVNGQEFRAALDLVSQVKRLRFPDSSELAQVESDLEARTLAEASPEALEALIGLGYVTLGK